MIDINDARLCSMNGSQRLAEKPFCGACIPLGTEQEVDRVAFRIHCSIEILPFTFDLDIGFIHSIGILRCLETRTASFIEFRGIMLNRDNSQNPLRKEDSLRLFGSILN